MLHPRRVTPGKKRSVLAKDKVMSDKERQALSACGGENVILLKFVGGEKRLGGGAKFHTFSKMKKNVFQRKGWGGCFFLGAGTQRSRGPG